MKNLIENLDQFLESDYYLSCESDYFLNVQYYYVNDPERAERMNKAFSKGNFGLTHRERIEDMSEALSLVTQDNFISDEVSEKIQKEIDELYQWHKKNNSLDDEI